VDIESTTILVKIVTVLLLLSMAQVNAVSGTKMEAESISSAPLRSRQLDDMTFGELDHFPIRYDSAGLDSFICTTMVDSHIPGVATWASKNGQVIWQQSYGYANINNSIPVADTTLFMLASISKTFVATAIMQLWERGVFELDDDINDYLPFDVRNPNYPDSIVTFRMLMTHTSSIEDNWPLIASLITWGGDSPIPLSSFLEDYLVPDGAYYDSSANFYSYPPGDAWGYCNVAVALLGYLVEAIEDSFPIYCQDSIFEPLSMYETSWFLAGLNTSNIAVPYHWAGSNYQAYQHYGHPFYPCGFLRTSTLQLARHLEAFIQYGMIDSVRILDSATVELMRTIQYQVNPQQEMGFIWMHKYMDSRWVWGHSGSYYGVRTWAYFCPAESSAVIVLTNCHSTGSAAIMNALFDYAEQYVFVEEGQVVTIKNSNPGATIFRGPLRLPEGKKCKVFDITGRVVEPDKIQPGIYFIEVDGVVTQKVVKVR
jgi:CubicO group peptidase (beta-lactamase class C family)